MVQHTHTHTHTEKQTCMRRTPICLQSSSLLNYSISDYAMTVSPLWKYKTPGWRVSRSCSIEHRMKRKITTFLTCTCAPNESLPFFHLSIASQWNKWGKSTHTHKTDSGIWWRIDNDARIQFKVMKESTFSLCNLHCAYTWVLCNLQPECVCVCVCSCV